MSLLIERMIEIKLREPKGCSLDGVWIKTCRIKDQPSGRGLELTRPDK